jgi:rod shape-determining protein MreC
MSFRDSPFSEIKVPLAITAAAAVTVGLIVSIALFVADRRETLEADAYGKTRAAMDMVQRPISGIVAAPVGWVRNISGGVGDYFFAVSENRRLKKENHDLRATHDQVVALQDVNERYRALLGLKLDPPVAMVSGRSVMDSRGPFANSRLVNVGKEAGVRVGNPVMSENGLVGRVVGVTSGASRVLLLTDVSSRTPVMIDRTNDRAILTGDGGRNPKLSYLRGREGPRQGDRVLTSGDGGVMPRGLPVGVVVKGLDGAWRVQLSSDRASIDFVRILKFEDFSQLVNMAELAAPIDPASMAGGLPPPPPKPAIALPAPPASASTPAAGTTAAPRAATPAAAATSAPASATPARTPAATPAPAPAQRPAARPQTRPAQAPLKPGEYRRVPQPATSQSASPPPTAAAR